MEGGREEVPSPLKLGEMNDTLDARTLLTGGSTGNKPQCILQKVSSIIPVVGRRVGKMGNRNLQ